MAQTPAQPQQPSLSSPKEERVVNPKVEGFKFLAKQLKSWDEIVDALAVSPTLQVAKEQSYLAVLNVESRDIRRNPYLFSTIYLKPDSIEVVYTLVPGSSPRKRKIDVLRQVLNVLSMLQGTYEIDAKYLFQVLQAALQDITEFATGEYKELFAKYDTMASEQEDMQKRVAELSKGNERLGKDLIDSRAKSDELVLRLRQLESFTDEAIMARIQDWLDVHHNEINITEFAKQFNVIESRVEDVLNKMIIQGYLELRG